MSDDKGNFKSDVSQSLIDAALESVRKRSEGSDVPVETEVAVEGGAAPPAGADGELEQVKAQLEVSMAQGRQMMDRLKDEHEKVLRAVADLENYKKRAAKEKEEVQRFGIEKLLKDFLPVVDNCDRALEAAKNPNDFESLRKGVEMIRKQFEDTLNKNGAKSFSSKGKPFDPNLHEAISQAETAEMPPNHVHSEVLRGFTLNDRLVRPALVVVSKAPAAPAAPTTPEGSTPDGGTTP